MTLSWKRIYAIFNKDLKDLSKNMYVSSVLIMPIVLAFLYSNMGEVTIELHYLVINMTLASVTAFIQCAVIAEEKEKHTLRGLMLSPASLTEILTGKSLVSFFLSIIAIVVCAMITGYEPTNLPVIAVALVISMLFYLALGTIMGLLSRTVLEASVIFLPIIFLFGFGSLLVLLVEQYPALSFIEYLPNIQLVEIAYDVEAGLGFGDVWLNLVILLAWAVVLSLLTAFVYKKKEMD
ncbi:MULTISPECIES: ABC transporter permease [Ornithinibacillus]|uniref:ABC transporter permease n=2 Tax=Ornithinibacillus TaxID=484508 RepID=A0A923RHZ3_9BACI|nr:MULTISPECIES: ABC transporter permease [Ornithinibacillus]MBC5636846.1 ABC transporter permease [Ornithinibacillus hominis]MBS3681412.1 ABC transporter permease [Ornithinibacillus massiliensis]